MSLAKQGKVYFVVGPGRIKIGYTVSPDNRLEKLRQVDMEKLEVLAVIDGTRRLERHLHRKLAPYRLKGEWFSDCPAVRNEIGLCSTFESTETNRPGSALDESGYVSEAADICDALIALERRSTGVSQARALSVVAIKTGLSHGRIWQLQYKRPKHVTAAEITALRSAPLVNKSTRVVIHTHPKDPPK